MNWQSDDRDEVIVTLMQMGLSGSSVLGAIRQADTSPMIYLGQGRTLNRDELTGQYTITGAELDATAGHTCGIEPGGVGYEASPGNCAACKAVAK